MTAPKNQPVTLAQIEEWLVEVYKRTQQQKFAEAAQTVNSARQYLKNCTEWHGDIDRKRELQIIFGEGALRPADEKDPTVTLAETPTSQKDPNEGKEQV